RSAMIAAQTTAWTGGQYSLVRIILGGWLAVHFAHLLAWGTEVFSNQGMLADRALSPLLALFPNAFLISDTPAAVAALLIAGIAGSVMLMVGWRDRTAAVV